MAGVDLREPQAGRDVKVDGVRGFSITCPPATAVGEKHFAIERHALTRVFARLELITTDDEGSPLDARRPDASRLKETEWLILTLDRLKPAIGATFIWWWIEGVQPLGCAEQAKAWTPFESRPSLITNLRLTPGQLAGARNAPRSLTGG